MRRFGGGQGYNQISSEFLVTACALTVLERTRIGLSGRVPRGILC